jgi:hypothetical protein
MNRLQNGNESDTSHSGWYDEMGATADQLFVVSTYTDFERLGEDLGTLSRTLEKVPTARKAHLLYAYSTSVQYFKAVAAEQAEGKLTLTPLFSVFQHERHGQMGCLLCYNRYSNVTNFQMFVFFAA